MREEATFIGTLMETKRDQYAIGDLHRSRFSHDSSSAVA